jgi:hypothetical protein
MKSESGQLSPEAAKFLFLAGHKVEYALPNYRAYYLITPFHLKLLEHFRDVHYRLRLP